MKTVSFPPCRNGGGLRQFLLLFILLFSLPASRAQGEAPPLPAPGGIFPLALLLEAAGLAASAGGVWQPPWPVQLPPDAFRVLSGPVSGITLEGEGVLLRFAYDAEGRVREFPFMLGGGMAQVSVTFRDGETGTITLKFPPNEDTWELEILESNPLHPGRSFPALVRAYIGGVWYFITLSRWAGGIDETWFDWEGAVLGGHVFYLTEDIVENQKIRAIRYLGADNNPVLQYYYDSWGFLTKVSGPGGVYSVLHYRDALPRFWERTGEDAGPFYFQWDANGFLARMVRTGAVEAEGGRPVEYRFEYTLDERGNWVERREIQMFRRGGLLFPAQGTVFRRVLEYRHL